MLCSYKRPWGAWANPGPPGSLGWGPMVGPDGPRSARGPLSHGGRPLLFAGAAGSRMLRACACHVVCVLRRRLLASCVELRRRSNPGVKQGPKFFGRGSRELPCPCSRVGGPMDQDSFVPKDCPFNAFCLTKAGKANQCKRCRANRCVWLGVMVTCLSFQMRVLCNHAQLAQPTKATRPPPPHNQAQHNTQNTTSNM